jgi:hypothetical protein
MFAASAGATDTDDLIALDNALAISRKPPI